MPLAGEGAMLAISTLTGKPFPTVKIAFDVSMVCISLITCLIFLHGLGSVGIGTVIAALLVGIELRMITHRFGRLARISCSANNPKSEATPQFNYAVVT